VPRAAPALVLAVPAPDDPAGARTVAGVTSVAAALCPAADIRAGYAGGGEPRLAALLASVAAERAAAPAGPDETCPYAAVVVPLSIAPDTCRDAALASEVATAGPAVTCTPHLGPHPLLAGALHDRLAEAGLVQARRISGLSLVSTTVGVLVGVPGGEPALRAAETVAVLLTARLGMPVAAVSLGSGDSLENGVVALREAGASRLVMAPYAIGHEISPGELAAAAEAAGAQSAAVIGAHPALGQLATMRYGAALLGQVS
jgi:sirohydrochlorin ferrochelatase